jgi:lauroyl/myristoyl acyltransferase
MAVPRYLFAPRYWLTWLGVALLWGMAWLPWRWRRWLGYRAGSVFFRHNRKRRDIVLTNLRLCFPEMDEAGRQQLALAHLQEYVSAMLDYSVLFFRSREWLYQRIRIHGREHIDRAIAEGRNVILLLGHSVWLEFAPLAIGQHYRSYGSYKPFRNPLADWLIARSRLKDVEFVVAREEGMMKLVRGLEPGRLMFLLPDEDHGIQHSVFAPFFGVAKATLGSPARLSRMGKAVALPIMAFRNPDDGFYEITVGEALVDYPRKDEVENATKLNQSLEKLVCQHPAQYMWLLKLFRTRPAGEAGFY